MTHCNGQIDHQKRKAGIEQGFINRRGWCPYSDESLWCQEDNCNNCQVYLDFKKGSKKA